MILDVDPRSPVPPYEQLRGQISALVSAGVLAPGTRLPAIRQLANDLGLAGGTVGRAYRELEAEGIITTRGRHGTVIAAGALRDAATSPRLLAAAKRFAADARRHGADLEQALAAVRAAFVSGNS